MSKLEFKTEDFKPHSSIERYDIDCEQAARIAQAKFDKWLSEQPVFYANNQNSPVWVSVEHASSRAGIGSFRVSRGGYFGQFRIEEFKEIEP